jgi:hypothetical protein
MTLLQLQPTGIQAKDGTLNFETNFWHCCTMIGKLFNYGVGITKLFVGLREKTAERGLENH